ncbi:MAG: DUF190 domain-containing protein [Bryobacterales bacterium]|nr:DUF190 domain-containing protein [Bryobacterales bacterium]
MPAKALLIFVDENDRWQEIPLYEALVQNLSRHHISGATAIRGLMGFGIHRRIHRKGLFGVADDKPVTIMAIDEEAKLRAVIPAVKLIIQEGLMVMVDVEVVS